MDLLLDDNNNSSSEKCYSLRPRMAPKKDEDDSDQEEATRPSARKKKKAKQKPGRLSKYRRKTANARERSRMREINEAFEALRRAIPHLTPCTETTGEKLTKISTLRLAMKYITALSNALSDAPGESDGESFLSDYSLTPSDPREHSMTPSSVSEHSDFYEQFFHKSIAGSISPRETVTASTELTFTVVDPDRPFTGQDIGRTLSPRVGSTFEPLPPFFDVSPAINDRLSSVSLQPSSVSDPMLRSALVASDVHEIAPPSELDSLLFPSLNFDELFIT